MAALPPMTVTFDDGTVITVEPKQRDLAGAEAAGHDFTSEANPIRAMYATAFAALARMARQGLLPEGFTVPESLEALLDTADVEGADDPDPEGKD